jgi:purine-binding chemotaxis protein CheW
MADKGVPDVTLATEDTYHHGYAQKQRVAFSREVLSFALGGEEYAIDILRIREILKHRPATEVPRVPTFILGVIAVRGQIIPVMDLRLRVRVAAAPPGKDGRILVVTHKGEPYGLLCDAVHQVVRMREEEVEPPPALLAGAEGDFIAGIGRPRPDRMLILLNLDTLLSFSVGRP